LEKGFSAQAIGTLREQKRRRIARTQQLRAIESGENKNPPAHEGADGLEESFFKRSAGAAFQKAA
jgi:hypothetical protein